MFHLLLGPSNFISIVSTDPVERRYYAYVPSSKPNQAERTVSISLLLLKCFDTTAPARRLKSSKQSFSLKANRFTDARKFGSDI